MGTNRSLIRGVAETPEESRAWVRDRFEHIVLYENRATAATARSLGDDRYEGTLRFEARKLRAGEQGEETEVPLDDPIDIGVFDADERPLYLERQRLDGSQSEISVQVQGNPATAGIDPYHQLIDRHPADNEPRGELAAS